MPDRTFTCPICGREFEYSSSFRGDLYDEKDNPVALRSYDCHGIPYRLLCCDCYDKVMDDPGYDGEYYTELDENIYDY